METLIDLLAEGRAYAPAELCARLRLSPPALTESVRALQAEGYRIGQTDGQGLRLLPDAGSILPAYIRQELASRHFGRAGVIYRAEMDSTNAVLKAAASQNVLAEGWLAVCERQTAGRGRMQRQWEDPEGGLNLTCTVLLRPAADAAGAAPVTLAVALAAAQALEDMGFASRIKWPNDIVLGGRKCVGILCEAVTDPAGALCVVAGTGFNVNQTAFAGELAQKATSLRIEGGKAFSRRALLCAYLLRLENVAAAFQSGGLLAVLPEYAARSATFGQRVRVTAPNETFEGVAQGVDGTGALLVRPDSGSQRRVLAGDVSVRGVMGYV